MTTRTTVVTVLASTVGLVFAGEAAATYPGPDGAIAYVDQDAEGSDIYAVLPDGRGAANVTRYCSGGPAQGEYSDIFIQAPDWSPDGSKLAHNRDLRFAVFSLAGGGPRTLGPHASSGAHWSPDGNRLAFSAADGHSGDIWVMDADGSGATNLTKSPGVDDFDPAWSPDGSRIAFVTGDLFGDVALAVMPASGGATTVLTTGPGFGKKLKYLNPDWAPDGSRVAVTRELWDDTVGFGLLERAVYVLNVDGSGLRRLTDSNIESLQPSWSPSGRRIAYSADRPDGEASAAVWTMNPDGSGAVPVVATQISYADPDWGSAKSYTGGPCGKPALPVGGSGGKPKTFGKLHKTGTGVAWTLGCVAGGGRCRATVTLAPAGRAAGIFGRTARWIAPGRQRTLSTRLNRAARRTLVRKERLRVRVRAAVSRKTGTKTAARTVTLRVSRRS